jgi:flagellar basal body rod protein FlgB
MKAINIQVLTVLVLALSVLLGLSGCATQPAGLSEAQVAVVAENVLNAINTNNYTAFTHDFSPQMKAAFPQTEFSKLQTMLQTTSGKFLYTEKPGISNAQGYARYRFPSKYDNEIVYVTLTFLIGGQQVEGLFFDSANLRKLPK